MRPLLLFALLLLAWTEARRQPRHHHQHCFNPTDVSLEFLSKAKRWDRHSAVQLVPLLEKEATERQTQTRHQEFNCPALQLENVRGSAIETRSLSPWRYIIDEDENRTPQRLAFAHCLCKGCIDSRTGQETSSLNSVPITKEMMVLRRKPCPHSNAEADAFTLVVDYIKVPVACACVLPQ